VRVQAQSAIISNAGFDSGVLSPWYLIQEAGSATATVTDGGQAQSGNYAARLDSANGTNTYYLKQLINLTAVEITHYIFAAYFKGNITGYQARIDIAQRDQYGIVITTTYGTPITLTSSYQQASLEMDTSDTWRTKQLELRLLITGTNATYGLRAWIDSSSVTWTQSYSWAYLYLTIRWNNTQNAFYTWNFSGSHPRSFSQLHPVIVSSTTPFNLTTRSPQIGGFANGTWQVLATTNTTSYRAIETVVLKYDSFVGPIFSTAPMNATVDQYTVRMTFHEVGLMNVSIRIDESFYPYPPRLIQLINAGEREKSQIEGYQVTIGGVTTNYPPMLNYSFRTLPLTARQDLIFSWAPSGYGASELIVVAVGTASVVAAGIVYVNRRRRNRP
jgi:hypothetical protein